MVGSVILMITTKYNNLEEKQINIFHNLFSIFNEKLFNNELKKPIILIDYNVKKATGYASNKRLIDNETKQENSVLGLNPDFFDDRLELLQTLAHEMCHLWEYQQPGYNSNNNRHTKLWADKMESIGLMPSSTGKIGGKRTGSKVLDYIIDYSPFAMEAQSILDNNREIAYLLGKLIKAKESRINKTYKYVCPLCKCTLRGKSGLDIICGVCMETMDEVVKTNA